jgi:hypothetical protein
MVDRRIRYLNSNGKIPAPGGGTQLLEEFRPPALSDLHRERLPAVRAAPVEVAPSLDPMKSVPVINGKKTSGNGRDVPLTKPKPLACAAEKKSAPGLEQSDPQEGSYFSESADRKSIAGHSGTILTFGRVEIIQGIRADSREKTVNALRQVLESVLSGDLPWELLQANYEGEAAPGERGHPGPLRGSKEIRVRHTDQSGHFAEILVPLGEGIVRGRALVACPGWFLLMLLFLAATCLALIAEQGFLNAGLFTHFLYSKAWIFVKLALIFSAALAALRGLLFSLFSKAVSRRKDGCGSMPAPQPIL